MAEVFKKRSKWDNPWTGIISGAIGPVIGFFVGYYFKLSSKAPISTYWRYLWDTMFQDEIFTFAMLPNMFLFFFFFFQWKHDQSSKGLVAVSLIYVVAFLSIKYL